MRLLSAVSFILLMAGCTATLNSTQQIRLREVELLMSQPTPSDWHPGSVWSFVQSGEDGSPVLKATFRVTDESAETCSSGNWRALELVEGEVGDGSIQLTHAYSVSGRLLTLDLTGGCDFGQIQGALSDGSFLGQTSGGPTTYGKSVPKRVVGRRLY